MLARRVIPCLDVDAGRVVKGTRFLDLRDAGDPVELAAFYDRAGADELVFLDITASSDERAILLDVVHATADQVFIPLTVGGGVRSVDDMGVLLEAGADKTAVNTAALDRPAPAGGGCAPPRLAVRGARHRCQAGWLQLDRLQSRRPPRHRPRCGGLGAGGDSAWRW